MGYVAFDLEIADDLPGDDEEMRHDLGITCAATVTDTGRTRVWHDNYAERMSKERACELVKYLATQHAENGKTIVTWNGLGFDFRVLQEASGMNVICQSLAINHIDIAFHMLCDKGFMCKLDKAAQGMNMEGKTEGMTGAIAPELWRRDRASQDMVLEYVKQDAVVTAELYERILEDRQMRWVTGRGNLGYWYPQMSEGRLLTVGEAVTLEQPDVSWMDDPSIWDRNRFYGWVKESP